VVQKNNQLHICYAATPAIDVYIIVVPLNWREIHELCMLLLVRCTLLLCALPQRPPLCRTLEPAPPISLTRYSKFRPLPRTTGLTPAHDDTRKT